MSDDDSLTLARQIAARAWCTDANAHKIMDVDLCDAFAHLMAAELDRLRAELAHATGECERLRGTVSALLEVAEMAVDTRKCRVGVLRAMNDARAILAGTPPAPPMSRAAEDVLSERQRQIDEEDWTVERLTLDSEYDDGQLVLAAACYVLAADGDWPASVEKLREALQWPGWLMKREWRDSLVRAAALLLAQIERDDSEAPPA